MRDWTSIPRKNWRGGGGAWPRLLGEPSPAPSPGGPIARVATRPGSVTLRRAEACQCFRLIHVHAGGRSSYLKDTVASVSAMVHSVGSGLQRQIFSSRRESRRAAETEEDEEEEAAVRTALTMVGRSPASRENTNTSVEAATVVEVGRVYHASVASSGGDVDQARPGATPMNPFPTSEMPSGKLDPVEPAAPTSGPEGRRVAADDVSVSTGSGLFHISYFTTNFGETYQYLARHVNDYFWGDGRVPAGSPPAVPVPATEGPVSQRVVRSHFRTGEFSRYRNLISFTFYRNLSSEKGSGAVMAPVAAATPTSDPSRAEGTADVRSEVAGRGLQLQAGASLTAASAAPSALESAKPAPGTIAPRATEEKGRRISLQREKIVARVSVDNRTRTLVRALRRPLSCGTHLSAVGDLCDHLLQFGDTASVAVKEGAVQSLLRLLQPAEPPLQACVREALTLLGYTEPVRGHGIRILSIDGGGTRGLVALETLQALTRLTGKRVHEMFDYVCGVSTGGVLAVMLGVFRIPLPECYELYRRLGTDIFTRNVLLGTVKMGWNHAFYDSHDWERLLREKMGDSLMIEVSRDPMCPKVSVVSTLVNRGTPLKAFVFRSYNLAPGSRSHYMGSCRHRLWEALRASSAAPGYFQEFQLGEDLHQDGGILLNNPSALAMHEAQLLWPGSHLQCLVSLGTGRHEPSGHVPPLTHTSLRTKLMHIISSATDTEEVHTILDGLLPAGTYFRFNPFISADVQLDESRTERLELLRTDAQQYLQRNGPKLQRATRQLERSRSSTQRVVDAARLQMKMSGVDWPSFNL
uniref:Calcium-independent phospholipase A2-gamma-like isoform X1 n=1 Tax=Petromyzon marinus TaxID=7757 RepID=A0AAJ7U1I2_PETMA|nr:calcium-independent phospholipase A2-gamma-like isoform X1 [Petromyzon marinus]XP_032828117.1 calcium-independent phospholipase A2-gamma-like isoform X1 [Petromyzon marinus]